MGFLLRDGAGGDEELPGGGSDFRDVVIGLGGFEVGAGLEQLLVYFGSFDFGEELTFFDGGADVEVPALQVAVGAGEDGRVDESDRVAGQGNFLRRSVGDWTHHGDDGDGGFVGGLGDVCFGVHAGANAEEDNKRNPGHGAGGKPQASAHLR